jgi:hypothetical protein
LSTSCEKHASCAIIFEDADNKYCEKCYQELEEKQKAQNSAADG